MEKKVKMEKSILENDERLTTQFKQKLGELTDLFKVMKNNNIYIEVIAGPTKQVKASNKDNERYYYRYIELDLLINDSYEISCKFTKNYEIL